MSLTRCISLDSTLSVFGIDARDFEANLVQRWNLERDLAYMASHPVGEDHVPIHTLTKNSTTRIHGSICNKQIMASTLETEPEQCQTI